MLQHGSYTLLIDACYDREQFPTMNEAIEWTWASSKEEIEAVEFVLRKFFVLTDDRYIQDHILEDILEYHSKAETNKRIAIERETKRKENSTNRAQVEHKPPPNHKPVTSNQEPLTNKPVTSKVKSIVEQTQLDPIESIFDYWKRVMDSAKSVMDDKRKALIVKALKNYSPADVCKAIRGCSKSPHNMGKNDRKTKYNGLNLILRDAEHIDYFINLDTAGAKQSAETISEMNARVMNEFLGDSQSDENIIEMEE